MKIDGREISKKILDDLTNRVKKLRINNIIPHLHIITLTTDATSNAYVSQKKLKGEGIGAKIAVENLNPKTQIAELLGKIRKLNNDLKVHGIIIQRPLPPQIDEEKIAKAIDPEKDVDGFHPNSKFTPPIALAVLEILKKIQGSTRGVDARKYINFNEWLKAKKITVVGRGVTAGEPILKTLKKTRSDLAIFSITSKTRNRRKILKNSDIVICAVGKPNTIKKNELKKGVILVGVGMFKGKDGKFRSDYDEDEIKNIVSFYTPTPRGVGPVNVAMLLSNLVKSTKNQLL